MGLVALLFTVLVLTPCAFSKPSRALLNIFQNENCETQFGSEDIREHLDPGEGRFHCFRNHVSCIDYDLHVLGSEASGRPNVLVVIAETGSVNTDEQNRLDSYLAHTVCIGNDCSQKVDVDESKHYSVIVLNSDFEDPFFNESSGQDVNYELDLYGCPTVTQRLVIVVIVVALLFAICGCFSCCVVYFRRSTRLEVMKGEQQGAAQNGDMSKSTQMTQQFSGINDAAVYPHQVHHHPGASSISESGQSAIPWATPVTSPTGTTTPMLPTRF